MKKLGHILARRLRGDLLLTDDPLTNRQARIITPGAWLTDDEQDILEEDTDQNYRLGTRMVIDDRVFRYCYAKEELNAQSGAFMAPQEYWEGNGDIPEVAAGVTELEFDNKAAEPILAHELKDGWIAGVATDATTIYCMRIKDNEASDGVGGAVPTCTITLYRPMPLGIVGAAHRVYVYPNMYANIVAAGGVAYNQCLGTVVCVPLFKVTAARYFWGLTWGIFYGLCGTWAANVGQTVNKRIFHFDGNGSMVYRNGAPTVDQYFQPAGYIMLDGANNQWGAITNGDQLCMLQLTP